MPTSWWVMNAGLWCWFRWIKAEPPCMKGELHIGYVVIGWQR